MIMMIVIFLFSGLIEHVSSIECYTCSGEDFSCHLPLNLDGGDESNESDVYTSSYDSDFACLSDRSLDPYTGKEKLILRGSQDCEEMNIPNHRVKCCYEDNCNGHSPAMIIRTLADIMAEEKQMESNSQHYLSSILLISFSIFCSVVLLN